MRTREHYSQRQDEAAFYRGVANKRQSEPPNSTVGFNAFIRSPLPPAHPMTRTMRQNAVLQMQQSRGNHYVQRMLGGSRQPSRPVTVQRCGAIPCNCSPDEKIKHMLESTGVEQAVQRSMTNGSRARHLDPSDRRRHHNLFDTSSTVQRQFLDDDGEEGESYAPAEATDYGASDSSGYSAYSSYSAPTEAASGEGSSWESAATGAEAESAGGSGYDQPADTQTEAEGDGANWMAGTGGDGADWTTGTGGGGESDESGFGLPDLGLPDVGLPDIVPDIELPDIGLPDVGLPDVGLPDVGLPDSGDTDPSAILDQIDLDAIMEQASESLLAAATVKQKLNEADDLIKRANEVLAGTTDLDLPQPTTGTSENDCCSKAQLQGFRVTIADKLLGLQREMEALRRAQARVRNALIEADLSCVGAIIALIVGLGTPVKIAFAAALTLALNCLRSFPAASNAFGDRDTAKKNLQGAMDSLANALSNFQTCREGNKNKQCTP